MKIDALKCQKCAKCIPFCPMGAIRVKEKNIIIEADECVECRVCQRSGVCEDGFFWREELAWPRIPFSGGEGMRKRVKKKNPVQQN